MTGPDAGQVEVSVFGPGFGECVLVHLGDDSWLIVDSCVDPESSEPAALQYLHAIGRDPATCVKCIVVTHWHDDHVRGLAETVKRCPEAIVALSSAFYDEQFLTLVEVMRHMEPRSSSGVSTLSAVLDAIEEDRRSWKLCIADRLLLRSDLDGGGRAEVHSLSPTDQMLVRAVAALGAVMPGEEVRRGLGVPSPNHASVVLWVQVDGVGVLLGADLEELPEGSWTKIVQSSLAPVTRADLFKVPHHGSSNGHCDLVWDELLSERPDVVLTEFTRLSSPLPTEADRDRLSQRAARVFITSSLAARRPRFANRVVGDMFAQSTTRARLLPAAMGQVQVRKNPASPNVPWAVQLLGPAERIRRVGSA